MASHLVLYRRVSDRTPIACVTNPKPDAEKDLGLIPVRLLTGSCPLCGTSVSKLSGAADPDPRDWRDA